MKKLLIILLTLSLLLGLCACGGPADDPAPEENPPTASDPAEPAGDPAEPTETDDTTPENDTSAPEEEDGDSEEGQAAPPEGSEDIKDPAEGDDPGQEPPAQTNNTPADPPDESDKGTQSGSEVSSQPPAPDPEPAPEPAPQPSEQTPEERKAAAMGLIGRPVSELYAAIGEPLSTDYSPSCLDLEGDDGELAYDGFTVYTLRNADGETVEDVV